MFIVIERQSLHFIKKLIKVFIIFSAASCGGSGDTEIVSGSPPASEGTSSEIRSDNPNRFHRDSRAFDDLPNSKVRDIEKANNLAEKNRYGTAIYGNITYQ